MQNFVENTINRIFKTVQISIAKTLRLLLESSDCLQTVFPYQYWIIQNFVENTITRIFKTVQISIAKTSRLLLESSDCLQTVFPYQYWITEILLFILCLVYCNLK